MSQILYERYKDALRRGHVAALRDRLEAAVDAYEEAASIAPDRALPHVSLGGVLQRLGRTAAAEAAYGAALLRAPGDESALRGRAALRVEFGRRLEAAADFEALAEILEAAGHLTEACDAARRALELAESRARRKNMERLAERLRTSDPDPSAAEALRLALQLLEPTTPRRAATSDAGDEEPVGTAPADDGESSSVAVPDEAASATPTAGEESDPLRWLAEAEAKLDAGDVASARDALLRIAVAHRVAGRLDAALDACMPLLALDPTDLAVQLEMAANQLARGWSAVATEKVRLLERIAGLDGDAAAAAAVAAFARDNAPLSLDVDRRAGGAGA